MNQSVRLQPLDLPSLIANLHRSSVGFDRMFADLNRVVADSSSANYPPFNIVKHSDVCYSIHIAVAGFREDELTVLLDNNILTVSGDQSEREKLDYMHQGISTRAFTRNFSLAEHAVIKGAKYENGLLIIDVTIEIPDALKPRKIEIASPGNKAIGATAGGGISN